MSRGSRFKAQSGKLVVVLGLGMGACLSSRGTPASGPGADVPAPGPSKTTLEAQRLIPDIREDRASVQTGPSQNRQTEGNLEIPFASPQGALDEVPSSVSVLFSRQMQSAMETLAADDPVGVVRRADTQEPVDGTWVWYGTRTASFIPSAEFSVATPYEVLVPQTTTALDGRHLETPYRFAFETPRPRLLQVELDPWPTEGRYVLDCTFNQELTETEVQRVLTLEGTLASQPVKLAYRFLEGSDQPYSKFKLELDPAAAEVSAARVVVREGVRSPVGPLTSQSGIEHPLPLPGPLRITLECSRDTEGSCDSSDSIALAFSKPVDVTTLAEHVAFFPRAPSTLDPSLWAEGGLDLDSLLEIAPGKRYRVVLHPGIEAMDGERMTDRRVFELRTSEEMPELVRGGREYAVLPRRDEPVILAFSPGTRQSAAEVLLAPLVPREALAWLASAGRRRASLADAPGMVRLTVDARRLPKRGLVHWFEVPETVMPRRGAGVFLAASRATPRRQSRGSAPHESPHVVVPTVPEIPQLYSVTDLKIRSKWSPFGGVFWVTSLSTGTPVAAATLAVYRGNAAGNPAEIFQTQTNSMGVALVPQQVASRFLTEEDPRALILAQHDDDWTVTRLEPHDASLVRPEAFIFAERRLYQPGETVHLKGYYRLASPKGLATPEKRRVVLTVTGSDGQVLATGRTSLDEYGAFHFPVALRQTAPLGFARAAVHLERSASPEVENEGRTGFEIARYRVMEFEGEASFDRDAYARSDMPRLSATGRYLYGAPMRGSKVRVMATLEPVGFAPPGHPGFDFSDIVEQPPYRWPTSERNLDERGKLDATFPLVLGGRQGAFQLTAEAELTDSSGRFVQGLADSALVHTSQFYLGLDVQDHEGRIVGEPLGVVVTAATPDGTPVEARDITVTWYEYPREPDGSTDGAIALDRLKVLASCKGVTTGVDPQCHYAPPDPGDYLVRVETMDWLGHATAAASTVAVFPPPVVDPPQPEPEPEPEPEPAEREEPVPTELGAFEVWCQQRPPAPYEIHSLERLERFDQGTHKVGKRLTFCVTAPKRPGHLLITLQRTGVLEQRVVALLPGGNVVSQDLGPHAFPEANVVFDWQAPDQTAGTAQTTEAKSVPSRPPIGTAARAAGADPPEPDHSSDSWTIEVLDQSKTLAVSLTTRRRFHPGGKARLSLEVSRNGIPSPAQVTLWAVDKGLELLRGGYSLRDPRDVFHMPRYTDVQSADTGVFLYSPGSHRTRAPSVRAGATTVSPGGAPLVRSKFAPVAFYLSSLEVDASGRAEVELTLPDNLTTWNVYAVAATRDDAFGTAQASFETQQPLMLQPVVPRVLREGDQFQASVSVSSLVPQELEALVTLRTDGVLLGYGQKRVTIPPKGRVAVSFPVEAQRPGSGAIELAVGAGKLDDRVRLSPIVQPAAVLEKASFSGVASKTVREALGSLATTRAELGGLELRLSASPMVQLEGAARALAEYPHECTEQLSSRLLGQLVRARQEAVLGSPASTITLQEGYDEILSRQTPNGGFAYWPGQSAESRWLATYVLFTLLQGRRAGVIVPSAVLDKVLAYLDGLPVKSLERDDSNPEMEAPPENESGRSTVPSQNLAAPPAEQAFLEDALASAGRPRRARIERLLSGIDTLPTSARAFLLHALALVDPSRARQYLPSLAREISMEGARAYLRPGAPGEDWAPFGSETRSDALALRAIAAVDPGHALVGPLVRSLLGRRMAGHWRNTQEDLWVLLALEAVFDAAAPSTATKLDASTRARAWLGSRPLLDGGLPVAQSSLVAIPMAELRSPHADSLLIDPGPARIFYEGELLFARRTMPVTPSSHGLSVERRILPAPTDSLPRARDRGFWVGDYAVLTVALGADMAHDQVAIDAPIPAGFEPVDLASAVTPSLHLPRIAWERRANHVAIHDDRVVFYLDNVRPGTTTVSHLLRATVRGWFLEPPASAECMYAPEIFGRSGAGRVEVR